MLDHIHIQSCRRLPIVEGGQWLFEIWSSDGMSQYEVVLDEEADTSGRPLISCSCPAGRYNKHDCKHRAMALAHRGHIKPGDVDDVLEAALLESNQRPDILALNEALNSSGGPAAVAPIALPSPDSSPPTSTPASITEDIIAAVEKASGLRFAAHLRNRVQHAVLQAVAG